MRSKPWEEQVVFVCRTSVNATQETDNNSSFLLRKTSSIYFLALQLEVVYAGISPLGGHLCKLLDHQMLNHLLVGG